MKARDDHDALLAGRHVLVTGGTGSLGAAVVERMLSGRHGQPERIVVFSRDEAKQHELRQRWRRMPRSGANPRPGASSFASATFAIAMHWRRLWMASTP